jgi:glucose-6-phosphate 1-dehydrogenase
VRGQYTGYRDVEGVAPGSDTETFVALRVEIDNWRWAGVPFYIRAGKAMPTRATEVRVVFKHPPRLGFIAGAHRPEPNHYILRIDPDPGTSIQLQSMRTGKPGVETVNLDVELGDPGTVTPTPYEELLAAALQGDRTHFTRQDSVEETWRIVQPALDAPPPVISYERGTWGPAEANKLTAGRGGWHKPWTTPVR